MKKFHKGLIASLAVLAAGTIGTAGAVAVVSGNKAKVDNNQPVITEPIDTRPKVEFVTNGGSAIETQHVDEGSTINIDSIPASIRPGYEFVGWFSDQSCTQPFLFDTQINDNIKLYARWTTSFSFDIATDEETNELYCIVTAYNGSETDITIPSEYDGLPVRVIGPNAFNPSRYLIPMSTDDADTTSSLTITIPDSIIAIGESAFKYCNLNSITIPDSIVYMGEEVFYYCENLTSVVIGNGVTGIERSTFEGCKNLISVKLGDSVTYIGELAFSNCASLSTINIPNGVESIDDGAFLGCSSLSTINLPDSVCNIGRSVFSCCSNLISFIVPKNVTGIDGYAFSWCTNLASVVIHSEVTSIGRQAFQGCANLISITIPESVEIVGYDIFDRCENLTTIYCEAKNQPDDWDSNWLYSCSATVVWDCNNVPAEEENA